MESRFSVGDHVRIRGVTGNSGRGIVIDVKEKFNGDHIPYIAVIVEYDEPLPREWPHQDQFYRRGQYSEGQLELLHEGAF